MKNVRILALGMSVLILTSCATIISGKFDKVTITSQPPNADVFIDGEKVGNTGATGNTIKVRKVYENNRTITLKKEGYNDTSFVVKQKIDPVFYLGVIPPAFGIPCFIDIFSGCALRLNENQFAKQLTPKK
jgi:hypothetical protein